MVSGKCGAAWLKLELVPTTRQSRRSQASARQNGTSYFDAPMTHCSSHRRLLQQNLPGADLNGLAFKPLAANRPARRLRTDRDACRGGFQTRPSLDFKTFSASMNVPASVASCTARLLRARHSQTRKHWIAFAITSRIILRGGRMTRTISRERRLPKQGGFETRPYKSPNLCAASRKRVLWTSADYCSGSKAPFFARHASSKADISS
jgi:hypothetical protein